MGIGPPRAFNMITEYELFKLYSKRQLPDFGRRIGKREENVWEFCSRKCNKCPVVKQCKAFDRYPVISNAEKVKWQEEHPEYLI